MSVKPVCIIAGILCWHPLALAPDPNAGLDSHNQVRSKVNAGAYPGQPIPDPPIPPMSWDLTLAAEAKAYAEQCLWTHSDDRGNQGENLAASTDLNFGIGEAVALWADEHVGYDYASGRCSIDACGHYTQLVWHNSQLVGCGDAVCSPLRRPSGGMLANQARYHVCRYATAGNINGESPYPIAGTNPGLLATYSERTRELTVPYALIWQPNNLIQPVGAVFELISTKPVRFAMTEVSNMTSADDLHVAIYDVGSTRLFVPQIDTLLGGVWPRNSAVLRLIPGKGDFQIELEHFR